jgi:hypothetical protein
VSVEPQFRFGRATGFVLAPFDGNLKSSFPDSFLGLTSNHMYDVYGRKPGTIATSLSPIDGGGPSSTWSYQPKGWISQLGLGSRDANPDNPVWKAPPGLEFPVRPDLDQTKARSAAEKIPNAYLGASLKATYSIDNLIPQAIKDFGCGGIVSVCIDLADVFVEPSVDVGFTSQLSFFQSEQSKWNGTVLPNTTVPVADLRPQNLDQAKSLEIRANSAAAAKFSLNAGLDLKISLSINTFFTKINQTLVDLEPRTTIASTTSAGYSANGKSATAKSYASQILSSKKFFQEYTLLNGSNVASGSSDGGLNHIKACLAKPSETAPPPSAPTYTPGNTKLLLDEVLYPCNICVGWAEVDYVDNAGKPQKVPAFLQSLFPASQALKPVADRWACKDLYEAGCYDQCSMNKQGKLTVVETAVEAVAKGETKKMPLTCARGQ